MKIYIIVLDSPHSESPWIAAAWDEWMLYENHSGYLEEVDKIKESNKNCDMREGCIEVPDTYLESLFKPKSVTGKVVEYGKDGAAR